MIKQALYFLLFLPTYFLHAQYSDWQSITNMNDITDMVIYNNRIVVASNGGAYIYNPIDDSIEKITNIEGLKSVDIIAVETDNHGNILFGSADGNLQAYNPAEETWTDIRYDGSDINDLTISGDTLWLASDEGAGVFVYKNNKWEYNDFFLNFPKTINSIKTIELFGGRVWLAADVGLLSASSNFNDVTLTNPQNWNVQTTQDSLPSNNITSLEVYKDSLWIGTQAGLAKQFKIGSGINLTAYNSAVNYMLATGENLHITRNNSHTVYNGNSYSTNANFSNTINSIVVDQEKITWYGINSRGLINNQNEKYAKVDGPLKNYVRFILKDNNDRIWTSTGNPQLFSGQGYSLFNQGNWTGYDFGGDSWYALGSTISIYEDRFENIWFGSWGGGIQVLTSNGLKFIHNHSSSGYSIITTSDTSYNSTLAPIESEYMNHISAANNGLEDYIVVTAFKEDFSGNMWIANSYAGNKQYIAVATYNGDFISLDPANWTYFGENDGIKLSEPKIMAIDFDIYGRLWIATYNDGVYILDYNNTLTTKNDDQLYSLKVDDGLNSNVVNTLANDTEGIMWIGTNGGLNSFDGTNVYNHIGDIDGKNGPVGSKINNIVVDEYNNKWIATDGGLSILKSGRTGFEPNAWVSYTTENSGLLSNIVNSLYIDNNKSEVFIGTELGISIFKGSFAETQNNFKKVIAGPNPFNLSKDFNFTIRMLKANSSIKIYDINGRLIKKLTPEKNTVEGGRATWDGKDFNGEQVAPGIYFYFAYAEDGKAFSGKVAVIKN